MSRLKAVIRRIEKKIDLYLLRLSRKHPRIFFFAAWIGTPLFILLSVCIGSILIVLLLSLISKLI
ncbi:MAG: hypothetical protein ACI4DY_05525 [Monoglobaceae bacterium]